MNSPVATILNSNSLHCDSNRKLNILCCPTHERYETGLALTGHNFYAFRAKGIKDWNTKYAPLPENYVLLDSRLGEGQLPSHVTFDLVLSQNKFGQYQVLANIARQLHLPLLSLEHTLPIKEWDNNTRSTLRSMEGVFNVFISSYSIEEWGFSDATNNVVIHHMVDTDIFKPLNCNRENVILSVVNDWVNREWCCNFSGWKRIAGGLPVRVVGDTPGLSLPAKNVQELAATYASSKIFLNTSTVSPVPTALLEAMAAGCACVSTATCMIPKEVIVHGENGLISNDEGELRKYCELLLRDNALAEKLGAAARQTILNKFNKETFVSNWNSVLLATSRKYYGE